MPAGQIPYYVWIPYAQKQGWSQRTFFAWARSKPGVWTARDSVMRESWHKQGQASAYVGAIESLSEDMLVPKSYMTMAREGALFSEYRYTVMYRAESEVGVGYGDEFYNVESDQMLTRGQVLDLVREAVTEEAELYGYTAYAFRIESAERWH